MQPFLLLKPKPIKSVGSFITTSFRKKIQRKRFEKAKFTFDSLGQTKKPIETMLTSVEGEDILEFSPCLSWYAGRPDCYFIVVSDTLKTILQGFSLPLHQWLEMEVRVNEILSDSKETRTYWMLQVVLDRAKDINYRESLFVSKPIDKSSTHPDTQYFEKGEVNSLETLNQLTHKEFEKNMHHIYPKNLVLNINFPILPHFNFGIIFNEEVKKAIEDAGFGLEQGVDFVEVDYDVVMPDLKQI